jgi:hypothetical protein
LRWRRIRAISHGDGHPSAQRRDGDTTHHR